ncbi:aminopeptidase P family protein [Aerococcaceae bacterium DSM 111022]|nr:aminopeptidase P family protein [Aerococcaceae bacterium DSM 111022]
MFKRLQQLVQQMNNQHIANQLISDPSSIRYFIDYHTDPGERLLLLTIYEDGTGDLYLNRLFPRPQLDNIFKNQIRIHYYSDGEPIIETIAENLRPGKSGIDKTWPSHFLLDLMDIYSDLTPINNSYIVDDIRGIKSEEEQSIMREASKFNDQAMEKLVELVQFGYSEIEMKEQLSNIYQDLDQDGFSFEPIIAYGPNGADPHHTTSNHKPDYGDTVVIDIGAMHQNYASDMTRTVFYGQPSDYALKVYETVRAANQAAIDIIKPGVTFREIDLAARNVIEEAGLGKFFTHRTGHFIGQECHEAGDVSQFNTTPCQIGQVFSIEPGIYLPGKLGVRIEDLVIVTETGCEVINHFTKEPLIIEPKH